MEERDNLRENEQKEGIGWELNPELPGERPMSFPLDHEDLIQKDAFLSGFKLYFCQFLLGNQSKIREIAIYMNHNGQPNIYNLGF